MRSENKSRHSLSTGRKKDLIAIVWGVLCKIEQNAKQFIESTNTNNTTYHQAQYQSSQYNPQYQYQHRLQQQIAYAQSNGICQQYNITSEHYSKLVKHINFIEGRSPFYHVLKRCCVMPVFAKKRIQFRISLSTEDVNHLLHSQLQNCYKKKGLHLRMFNSVTHEHQQWSTSNCEVCINNRRIMIDNRDKRTGTKKRGHHIVAPLVITAYSNTNMDFEITSNGNFCGVAVIEIVLVYSVDCIVKQVIARCTPPDPQQEKECAICKISNELLRCSRCKSVWYCGTEHQARDWAYHQTICISAETRPQLKTIEFKTNDNDVICGETKVSLRCPLSICRISMAVRGTECYHPQCMDLKTFLSFSHWTGCWQCPTCTKPLKFNELVVDTEMMRILRETDDDIDVVRLHPNGTFKPITLQEQREEDKKSQVGVRKRKLNQITPSDDDGNSNSSVVVSSASPEGNGRTNESCDSVVDHGQTVDNPILLE